MLLAIGCGLVVNVYSKQKLLLSERKKGGKENKGFDRATGKKVVFLNV